MTKVGSLFRRMVSAIADHAPITDPTADVLKKRMPLNPFGEVELVARVGSFSWSLLLAVQPHDARYNPGIARLNKREVERVLSAVAKAVADARYTGNFNSEAKRERRSGPYGGLTVIATFYPQGHVAVQFHAQSTTFGHARFVGDIPTVIGQLEAIIRAGDLMIGATTPSSPSED